MIRLTLAVLALVATAAPAVADSWTQTSFTRDGEKYVVNSRAENGAQHLRGHIVGGKSFDLIVRNGLVIGDMNGHPVRFRADEAGPKELAAR